MTMLAWRAFHYPVGDGMVARYFAIGRARSGPGEIVIAGLISPAVPISNGVTALIRVDVDG